jgi:hypothetical protein
MTIVRIGQTWKRIAVPGDPTDGVLLKIEVIRRIPTWSIVHGVYAAVGEQAEYPRADGAPEGLPIYSFYMGLPIAEDGTPAYPGSWELIADTPIGDA